MVRGRPVKSVIRDRMQSITDALGVTYGYEIHKAYQEVFEPIDLRSIYYHLAKGTQLGEFEEVGVKEVKGTFTWGNKSIRIYYLIGPQAANKASSDIINTLKTVGMERREPKDFVDWEIVLKKQASELKNELEKVQTGSKTAADVVEKTTQALDWFEVRGFNKLTELRNLKDQAEKLIKKQVK